MNHIGVFLLTLGICLGGFFMVAVVITAATMPELHDPTRPQTLNNISRYMKLIVASIVCIALGAFFISFGS